MKLNKLFFTLLSAIMLIGFSSCGSDDDDDITKEDIVGKWSFDKASFDLQTNKPAFDKMWKEYYTQGIPTDEDKINYEFDAKGNFVQKDGKGNEDDRGVYAIKNNMLTMTSEGGYYKRVFTFSGSTNKLVLEMDLKSYFQEELEELEEAGLLEGIDVSGIKVNKMIVKQTFKRISDK